LFVMPALLMVSHASKKKSSKRSKQPEPAPKPAEEQKPFVGESAKEVQTLWPEPDQGGEWPPNDVAKNQRQSQQARTNA
jgi:hypothetical protein